MARCIYIALLFSKSVQIYHLISLLQHISERGSPRPPCTVHGETMFSRALRFTDAPQGGWQPCSNGSEVRVTTGGRTLRSLVGPPLFPLSYLPSRLPRGASFTTCLESVLLHLLPPPQILQRPTCPTEYHSNNSANSHGLLYDWTLSRAHRI